MTTALLLTLVALALVDSTSFGTLGIPVVMLLSSGRSQTGRMLIYLATISLFYFLVGVALMLGLSAALENFGDVLRSRPAYWVQFFVGVGLFALSFRFDSKKPHKQWEPRLGGPLAMVTLGLTAGLIEVATMVPYLAAIGIMGTAGLAVAQWGPLLAGYVLVMIVPPLALMALRAVAGERVEARLERLRAWILKNARSAVGWSLGIVGFLLAGGAASTLFSV
ncbi:GAP family protein [Nonomuraea sp. NBC_01738]|uniref:GAP family protein n=1 Tax=Nonomuraea sp. NBC_01738 TaxID=2976003 RepID=UPI002E1501EC|nr:GAP family protein [Nonomuraea sp. NBC_01738]